MTIKKVILKTLCLYFSLTWVFGEGVIFEEANNYYKNKQYEDALHLYKKLVIDGDGKNYSLYYNIGNVFAKLYLDNPASSNLYLAKSIYYYLLSQQIAPDDEDTQHNLDYLKSFLKDTLEKDDSPLKWLKKKRFILLPWLYLITSFLLLIITLVVSFFVTRKLKQSSSADKSNMGRGHKSFKRISGSLAGLTIIFFFFIVVIEGIESSPKAVIFSQKAWVYSSPSYEGELSFQLHEGTQVHIKSQEDEWYQIVIDNGLSGWIERESCRVVEISTVDK